jgi:hypothetical protein
MGAIVLHIRVTDLANLRNFSDQNSGVQDWLEVCVTVIKAVHQYNPHQSIWVNSFRRPKLAIRPSAQNLDNNTQQAITLTIATPQSLPRHGDERLANQKQRGIPFFLLSRPAKTDVIMRCRHLTLCCVEADWLGLFAAKRDYDHIYAPALVQVQFRKLRLDYRGLFHVCLT